MQKLNVPETTWRKFEASNLDKLLTKLRVGFFNRLLRKNRLSMHISYVAYTDLCKICTGFILSVLAITLKILCLAKEFYQYQFIIISMFLLC